MDGVVVTPMGAPARDALLAAVAAAKAHDACAPVTVVVPSNYAGLHLRRTLAAQGRGSVNVRFLTLARAAELMATPILARAGRVPRGPHHERAAVEAALAGHPGRFSTLSGHPVVIDRLVVAMRELDRAPAGVPFRPPAGSVAADVLAIHHRYGQFLRDTYDDEAMLTAAIFALDGAPSGPGGATEELGTVIVFDPVELSPTADRFIARLLHRDPPAVVIVGLPGDPDLDAAARAFAGRLGPVTAPGTGPGGSGFRRVPHRVGISAPDPEDEVREVVRRIRVLTDDPTHPVDPAAIAVTYGIDVPYARIVQSLLTEAALPFSAPSLLRLTDSVAGRTLLGLLTLPDHHFRRDAVIDLVASAPVREPGSGRFAPGARWDRVSRRAGVVEGPHQWATRLHAYIERERARSGGPAPGDPDTSNAGAAARLAVFVADLVAATADPHDRTWTGWAEWAGGLLRTYLGRPGRRWPDAEIEAHDRVLERLRALTELDTFPTPALPVSRIRFLETLRAELAAVVGHTGQVGTGVFVAPLGALRGCTFHSVFVLGLADGRLPAGLQPDPLLPDATRVGVGLPRVAARLDRERTAFLAATTAATDSLTVAYARSDPRAAQALQPSPWIATVVSEPLHEIPSFTGAVATASTPASVADLARQELLRWRLAGADPLTHPTFVTGELRRGFGAIAARASSDLTAYDGHIEVGTDPAHDPLGDDRPQSATKLEQFATCPFRFFLASVLRLRPEESPEEAESIDPRNRGLIIHEVLDRFLRRRAQEIPAPGVPWDDAAFDELQAVATEVIGEFEVKGELGRPTLWRFEEPRLRRELGNVLIADAVIRGEYRSRPAHFEAGFGGTEAGSLPPVRVRVDESTTVSFRGRIDRIDRTESGGAVVFDYKTGRYTRSELEQSRVDGGRKLQLAIYGRAAREYAPSGEVDAAYWYTRQPPRAAKTLSSIPVDDDTDHALDDAVTQIAGAIRAGTFPMVPGDEDRNSFTNCRRCDFNRLCPADRARAWDRKEADPALAPVHSLFDLRAPGGSSGASGPTGIAAP